MRQHDFVLFVIMGRLWVCLWIRAVTLYKISHQIFTYIPVTFGI